MGWSKIQWGKAFVLGSEMLVICILVKYIADCRLLLAPTRVASCPAFDRVPIHSFVTFAIHPSVWPGWTTAGRILMLDACSWSFGHTMLQTLVASCSASFVPTPFHKLTRSTYSYRIPSVASLKGTLSHYLFTSELDVLACLPTHRLFVVFTSSLEGQSPMNDVGDLHRSLINRIDSSALIS